MRVKEETVYSFSELSELAKETAREYWRNHCHPEPEEMSEAIIEDAIRLGRMIGLELETDTYRTMGGGTGKKASVYWSIDRDSGLSFKGSYSYRPGSVRALASEAPEKADDPSYKHNNDINRIARDLRDLQRRSFYALTASVGHSRGRDLRLDVDVYDSRTGDEAPEEIREALKEILEDFASWILAGIEAQYEYLISDEAVDEALEANEYEFTEEGRIA